MDLSFCQYQVYKTDPTLFISAKARSIKADVYHNRIISYIYFCFLFYSDGNGSFQIRGRVGNGVTVTLTSSLHYMPF